MASLLRESDSVPSIVVVAALPEVHNELPVASTEVAVSDFSKLLQQLHLAGDRDEAGELNHSELLSYLGWLADILPLDASYVVPEFPKVVHALLDSVLLKTRFGMRFAFKLAHRDSVDDPASAEAAASGIYRSAVPHRHPLAEGSIPGETSHALLHLDLSPHSPSETVSLIPLLNSRFRHHPATLFGQANPTSQIPNTYPSSSSSDEHPTLFTILPHFLTISFDRKVLDPPARDAKYHSTTVELPLEIDLGFYLDPRAPPPVIHMARGGRSGSATFYRLHSFVTQANGKYLCYTRLRGGNEWYRCADENISVVDLGSRVASKGIMLAIFRLQD
eukprot:jgi/Hompol1/6906/HPOL_002390-RA